MARACEGCSKKKKEEEEREKKSFLQKDFLCLSQNLLKQTENISVLGRIRFVSSALRSASKFGRSLRIFSDFLPDTERDREVNCLSACSR